VTCLEVRELLPEMAVGVLSSEDRELVERHLQWCAGCRKEATDLGAAAATFAFALDPVPMPQGLGDRVVARVRRAAGAPGTPRRARMVAASIVAAMVAVGSLGWGAVMAGRAERFAVRAERAEREQAEALEQFQRVLAGVFPGRELPDDQTHLGQLAPVGAGAGGGAVLQMVSPTILDFVMVIVSGLDPAESAGLPYRVRLANDRGEVLRAGRIAELDADGGAEVFHQFKTADLTGYTMVDVVDASGEVVLSGVVDQSA
jgi:predicted anti-sigma-YlaC factor YlaD